MSNEPVLSLLVAEPTDSVLVKLVLSLLQLCKLAANHPGGADILGIHLKKLLQRQQLCLSAMSGHINHFQMCSCRGSRQLSGRTGSCRFLHHRPASWQRPSL